MPVLYEGNYLSSRLAQGDSCSLSRIQILCDTGSFVLVVME